jgi:hypothetical protein
MKKPKIYDINSFDKLINVASSENFSRLSVDLLNWLMFCVNIIENYRKQYPEQSKSKTNSQLIKCSFKWIDDGKNDLKSIEITNPITGEVTTKKL